MVILHLDSRPLTYMLIDIGRFQWTWLSMGTVVASDVFQKKLDEIFCNVPGVTGIAGWYGLLQEINQGTWQTFPELPVNSEKEELETECFKITISTWVSILLWTQLEFQGNITRSQENSRHSTDGFSTRQSQCKVSLGWSISWTDVLQDSWNCPLLSDSYADYMLIINLNENITILSML